MIGATDLCLSSVSLLHARFVTPLLFLSAVIVIVIVVIIII